MVKAFLPIDSTGRKLRDDPHPCYSMAEQKFPLAGGLAEAGRSGAGPKLSSSPTQWGHLLRGQFPTECRVTPWFFTLWFCHSGPAFKSWPILKQQEGFSGATMHSRVRCQQGFRGQGCLSRTELDPTPEEGQPCPGSEAGCSPGQKQHISDLFLKRGAYKRRKTEM